MNQILKSNYYFDKSTRYGRRTALSSIQIFFILLLVLVVLLFANPTRALAQIGNWTVDNVTTGGSTNNFVSVTTDSSGNFFGAWRPAGGTSGLIEIGAWNGSSWSVTSSFSPSDSTLFDSLGDGVSWRWIAMATITLLFIASASGDNGVFYATYNGSSWSFEEVQSAAAGNYRRPRIDVDSTNNPHIAFEFDNNGFSIDYAVKNTSWAVSM